MLRVVEITTPMITAEETKGLLRIYHASALSEPVLHLAKIARCMGVTTESIDLKPSDAPAEQLRLQLAAQAGPSVWDLGSLGPLITSADWISLAARMLASPTDVILLVTGEDDLQREILNILSQGGVAGLRSVGQADSVMFPPHPQGLSGELGGQRYQRFSRNALAMDLNDVPGFQIVMELAEGLPAFVAFQRPAGWTFIWSTLHVFDVERPLAKEMEFERSLDEYIPAIIFLRKAFGDLCWQSPTVGANLIIDDPLLTKKYGFIDFPKLLPLAKTLGIHLTVAFIPWNQWRTEKRIVKGFLDFPESFGICAHGCDHTRNEFRSSDYPDLLRRTYLAVERMERHRERTGMGWAPLMVCPREDYTIDALRAFADSGRFLGLMNSGCIPLDSDKKTVRGADLLLPVQDSFFGFAIFKRHYWSDIAPFAMAVFLGKPAIMVEHHGFFGDEHQALKESVAQLNRICPNVRWSNLTELARRACHRRRLAPGSFAVRFFTDEFVVDNPDPEPRMMHFLRRIPGDTVIESVSVNAVPVRFTRDGEFIRFETVVGAKGVAMVHLKRRAAPNHLRNSRGLIYNVRVATRRFASEIRDNWLARNQIALHVANRFMQAMRLRGRK
ncbi:MAG: hypothetical protein JWM16_744 [Verrucomicrobiales bacterium]|nr:hypothetical protein [Verrucomicrobiales bacterium]